MTTSTQYARQRANQRFLDFRGLLEKGRTGDGSAPRRLVLQLLADAASCEHWCALRAALLCSRYEANPADPYRRHLDEVLSWLDDEGLSDDDLRELAADEPVSEEPDFDACIKALSIEAAAAGDEEQVDLCRRALEGDLGARLECLRALEMAEAMGDDEGGRR